MRLFLRLLHHCLSSIFAPGRAVFDDPIEQSPFKTDVVTGFLTFQPFMDENLFPLGKKLAVQDGVLDEIRVF